jgi:hypothetical protein
MVLCCADIFWFESKQVKLQTQGSGFHTEKSIHRKMLTERPFDHLTEHRLIECHFTESTFDRIADLLKTV